MRRSVYGLAALLLFAAANFGDNGTAAAASKKAPTVIDSFVADPGNQLTPGTEITFTVEGTAKGKATVRIAGVPRTINLPEVEPGLYEGTYTVRNSDKIAPNASARAALKARGRTAVSTLQFRAAQAAPPVAAAPPQPAPPAPTPPPAAPAAKIERFTVVPVDRLDPGTDLRFTLIGTPGGKAVLGIQGVNREIPMQEVKPGLYEGSYTVRRLDHFPPSGEIFARLESGGQVARTRLNQSLLVDAKPPVLRNQSPRDGETVPPGQISVSATFDDSGGLGVDPKSVRIFFDGRDVTQNSSVTGQFFTYRVAPPPGTHQVLVQAQDLAGNAMKQGWSFSVGAPAAGALPLEFTSHANNALIPGGSTQVRGRTAPGATVDLRVTQTANVVGLFGVNQELLKQSVQADANGNFAVSFQPQISVPGARYEITGKARAGQSTSRDIQLVLFQQK